MAAVIVFLTALNLMVEILVIIKLKGLEGLKNLFC